MKYAMMWRGIGVIPNSGLALKGEYAAYDVELVLPINLDKPSLILKAVNVDVFCKGLIKPSECPLFGKAVPQIIQLVLVWYL